MFKVLVAEDSDFNQLVIAQTISKLGYNVTFVHDGNEAINQLKLSDFDIILMDIEMPVMDGIAATQIIRSDFGEPKKSIPIIALTAHTDTKYLQQLNEIGFNFHYGKSFDKWQLNNKVIELVQKWNFEKDSFFRKTPRHYKLTGTIKLGISDRNLIIDMVNYFIKDTPSSVQKMFDFIETHDLQSIKNESTKLSYHFTFFGLETETKLMHQIDFLCSDVQNINYIKTIVENIQTVCECVIGELKEDYEVV